MTAVIREAPHHRSLYCVKQFGCQRPECRARNSAYSRRRYRQVGYGTWNPLSDAEPVRQHIAALREAGHSLPAIQQMARVSAATIARVLYDGVNPRAERIRTEVARRILDLPVETAPTTPNTIVDGTGTRRRIQALVWMGWTYTKLGPHLGIHPRRLTDLARAEHVTAATAQKIANAYRVIQTWQPGHHGVPKASLTMARNIAIHEGWHGPLAWDDIDNPAAKPETAQGRHRPGLARPDVDPRRVIRLTTEGLSAAEIAARLGCHKRTVVRARRKAEELAVAA
ncbi:helix-turn-helix domain-containing protein [Streptomyces lasiicapitis]|uniref:helix-turn-helix domain-containing protein n=1 Tax=Streptomyces lasiicapitis TaxID=1923961 RepID=UPI00368DBC67